MYAGAPKIEQEFFFWSYHLTICSSNLRTYFAVEKHLYVQLCSSGYYPHWSRNLVSPVSGIFPIVLFTP